MDARLQRRIQRYGWDLAAQDYESLWQAQLADARCALLEAAALTAGERVLDVACGTGLVSFAAANAVGATGQVVGIDLSERMVSRAQQRADEQQRSRISFSRMDAEKLALPDASVDVAVCALGLMYFPDPLQALREMHRVLRPGGRIALAVWGERSRCGWSPVFPIVDAEVDSDVCPSFFSLGQHDAMKQLCTAANFAAVQQRRVPTTLHYASADEACDAAFVGGPVAMAWSRFDAATRSRVQARYVEAIAPWRSDRGYAIAGEFVIASAVKIVMQRSIDTTIGAG